jgi:hypothetical protein
MDRVSSDASADAEMKMKRAFFLTLFSISVLAFPTYAGAQQLPKVWVGGPNPPPCFRAVQVNGKWVSRSVACYEARAANYRGERGRQRFSLRTALDNVDSYERYGPPLPALLGLLPSGSPVVDVLSTGLAVGRGVVALLAQDGQELRPSLEKPAALADGLEGAVELLGPSAPAVGEQTSDQPVGAAGYSCLHVRRPMRTSPHR